jgi:hypothetical protein
MTKMIKKAMWLPITAACVVALAGCSSSATAGQGHAADAGVNVTTVSGYELPGGYGDALDHQGNDAIFTAVVSDQLPAKKFTPPVGGGTSMAYVYTPVRVQIATVLKAGGGTLRPGQLVTLRVMGGATATDSTINEITAGPDLYKAGRTVQVFSQPPFVDPDTGEIQYVPNWSFAESADHKSLANLHEPSVTIPLGTALAQAQQKADSSGWKK